MGDTLRRGRFLRLRHGTLGKPDTAESKRWGNWAESLSSDPGGRSCCACRKYCQQLEDMWAWDDTPGYPRKWLKTPCRWISTALEGGPPSLDNFSTNINVTSVGSTGWWNPPHSSVFQMALRCVKSAKEMMMNLKFWKTGNNMRPKIINRTVRASCGIDLNINWSHLTQCDDQMYFFSRGHSATFASS